MYLTKLTRIGPHIKAVKPFSGWAITPIGPRRLALRATIILLGLFLTFSLIRNPAHSQSFILSEQEVHPLLGEEAPNLRVFVNGPLLRASDNSHPALKGLPLLPSLIHTAPDSTDSSAERTRSTQAASAQNTADAANRTASHGAPPQGIAVPDTSEFVYVDTDRPDPRPVFYGEAGRLLLAIAAHRMQEAGLIDLDAPLHTLLPDLIEDEPFQVQLTVRHILDGTSGFSVPRTAIDVSKLEHYLVKTQRHGLMYHNDPVAYELLTLALEKASGLSILDMLNVWALEPAGAPIVPIMPDAENPALDPSTPYVSLLSHGDYFILTDARTATPIGGSSGMEHVGTARIDRLSGSIAPLIRVAQRLQERDRSAYLSPASKNQLFEHVSWRMHPMGLRRTLGLSESIVAGRHMLRTMPLEQAALVPEEGNLVRLFVPRDRGSSGPGSSGHSSREGSVSSDSISSTTPQALMPPTLCVPGVSFVMMPSADVTFLDVREVPSSCTYYFAERVGQLLAQYVPPGGLGDTPLAQARGATMHSLPTGLYVQESAPNASLLARLSAYRHRTAHVSKIDDATISLNGILYRVEAPYAFRALAPTATTPPALPQEQTGAPTIAARPASKAQTPESGADLMTFHPFKAGGYMRVNGQTWRHVGPIGMPEMVLDPFALLLLIVLSGGIYWKWGHNKAWRHMGRYSLIGSLLFAGGIACELLYFEAALFGLGSLWPVVLWRLAMNLGLALLLSLPLYAWQFTRKADMPTGPAAFIAPIHLTALTAASLLLFLMAAAWGVAGHLSPY